MSESQFFFQAYDAAKICQGAFEEPSLSTRGYNRYGILHIQDINIYASVAEALWSQADDVGRRMMIQKMIHHINTRWRFRNWKTSKTILKYTLVSCNLLEEIKQTYWNKGGPQRGIIL